MAQEATDLYELDLATGSVRRLTTDGNDGWIIPEFTWDPNEYTSGSRRTACRLGRALATPGPSRPVAPAGLEQLLDNLPIGDAGHALASDAALPIKQRTRILEFKLRGRR